MAKKRHFGNLRRRPSGRYQASYWHLGRRHVADRTFATKAEANAFLDTTSARIHGRECLPDRLRRLHRTAQRRAGDRAAQHAPTGGSRSAPTSDRARGTSTAGCSM